MTALMFIFVGLAFTVLGVLFLYQGLRMARVGVRVTAEIVDVDSERDRQGGTVYYPVVRFTTADGQEVRARTNTSVAWTFGKVGKRIRVIYDPGDPQSVMTDSLWGRGTLIGGLIALVGVGMLAIRVYYWNNWS